MILTIIGLAILILAVLFLVYGIQLHGWLNPNPPKMSEEHRRLNRKFYIQAYVFSGICFLIDFLLVAK